MNAIVIQFCGDLAVNRDCLAKKLCDLITTQIEDPNVVSINFLNEKDVADALIRLTIAPSNVVIKDETEDITKMPRYRGLVEICQIILAKCAKINKQDLTAFNKSLIRILISSSDFLSKNHNILLKISQIHDVQSNEYAILKEFNLEHLPEFLRNIDKDFRIF